MKRIKLKGGDEYDALTKAKKYYHWKPGERKKIKRGYNKRFRKYGYNEKVASTNAGVAQLEERNLAKVKVESSSLFTRSN